MFAHVLIGFYINKLKGTYCCCLIWIVVFVTANWIIELLEFEFERVLLEHDLRVHQYVLQKHDPFDVIWIK